MPSEEAQIGKFMYDVVAQRLAAQSADQSALVGRSKDLVGLATLTSSVAGVLANDKLVRVVGGQRLPVAFAGLLSLGLLLTIGSGLYVLYPRKWFLSFDPVSLFEKISEHYREWPLDKFYASAATAFLNPGELGDEMEAILVNDAQLRRMHFAVGLQILGAGILGASGLYLAWNAT